jgi:hypothetical protein
MSYSLLHIYKEGKSMSTVEFDTIIQNGKISIPSQYLRDLSSRVRVILIQDEGKPTGQEKGRSFDGHTKNMPFYIYGETAEEIAFKQRLDPKKELEDFNKLNKTFDEIDDEPLDEEFFNAVNCILPSA